MLLLVVPQSGNDKAEGKKDEECFVDKVSRQINSARRDCEQRSGSQRAYRSQSSPEQQDQPNGCQPEDRGHQPNGYRVESVLVLRSCTEQKSQNPRNDSGEVIDRRTVIILSLIHISEPTR